MESILQNSWWLKTAIVTLVQLLLLPPAGGCGDDRLPADYSANHTKAQSQENSNATDTAKETTPAQEETTQNASHPTLIPVDLQTSEELPLRSGWVKLTQKKENEQRSWIEGEVISDDKLSITTENMAVFDLDLSRISMDWSGSVVLRIDGFNSELRRKDRTVLRMQRSASGGWTVAESW